MTNIYRREFIARCPVNQHPIRYRLTIQTEGRLITVEDIVRVTSELVSGYHEAIADELHAVFGGSQTMVAFHHGVEIETRRGGA
jgi:hypothetical protein